MHKEEEVEASKEQGDVEEKPKEAVEEVVSKPKEQAEKKAAPKSPKTMPPTAAAPAPSPDEVDSTTVKPKEKVEKAQVSYFFRPTTNV